VSNSAIPCAASDATTLLSLVDLSLIARLRDGVIDA
jgi:hypothetical protein